MPTRHPFWIDALACLAVAAVTCPLVMAQPPNVRIGELVPRDVREMYDRGLQFLTSTQTETGDWGVAGGHQGAGRTGLGLMCYLASGEDPNVGIHSLPIRRALQSIISQQNSSTGYLGSSMYHHGFGMLALAEAYGTVDDRLLWADSKHRGEPRLIGTSLELAVRAAITSQKKNSSKAWRYSPDSTDADTSVSGAVLVGLLAARNAGIEVPDESIDQAISYYVSMTSKTGHVSYSRGSAGESMARISIATLVYALARRKDLPEYKATLGYLVERLEGAGNSGHGGAEYQRYYQAQALFQADFAAWEKWNKLLVRQLKQSQRPDGSWQGQIDPAVATSMNLLSLALNFRFLPIYER